MNCSFLYNAWSFDKIHAFQCIPSIQSSFLAKPSHFIQRIRLSTDMQHLFRGEHQLAESPPRGLWPNCSAWLMRHFHYISTLKHHNNAANTQRTWSAPFFSDDINKSFLVVSSQDRTYFLVILLVQNISTSTSSCTSTIQTLWVILLVTVHVSDPHMRADHTYITYHGLQDIKQQTVWQEGVQAIYQSLKYANGMLK